MYLHSFLGKILIRRREHGITFHAPCYGLQEVSLDKNELKVIKDHQD